MFCIYVVMVTLSFIFQASSLFLVTYQNWPIPRNRITNTFKKNLPASSANWTTKRCRCRPISTRSATSNGVQLPRERNKIGNRTCAPKPVVMPHRISSDRVRKWANPRRRNRLKSERSKRRKACLKSIIPCQRWTSSLPWPKLLNRNPQNESRRPKKTGPVLERKPTNPSPANQPMISFPVSSPRYVS